VGGFEILLCQSDGSVPTGQALGSSLYRLLKNLFFSLAPADRNQKRNNFHGRFERFEAISEMMGVFQQPVNLT